MSAALLGHDDKRIDAWERAYQVFVAHGDVARALRTTFWLCVALMSSGEIARASGWFARGQRLLDHEGGDEHERAYLAIPAALQHLESGDAPTAMTMFDEIAAAAERTGDSDLGASADSVAANRACGRATSRRA